jgi:hypothetical protein
MTDRWAILRGWGSITDYLSFVASAAERGADIDVAAAADRWREAADVVASRRDVQAGAGDARPAPFDDETGRVASYLNHASVQAAFGDSDLSVQLVPLGRVISWQRQMNLSHVERLVAVITENSAEPGWLLDFCLGIIRDEAPISGWQEAADSFVFASPSTDARFLGASLHEAPAESADVLPGHPAAMMSVFFGFGVNPIRVVDTGNRLLLDNGSHRAFALLLAGHAHAPALVERLTDASRLPPLVQRDPDSYLTHSRPPLLRDFGDPDLAETFEAPKQLRHTRVRISIETFDDPAS